MEQLQLEMKEKEKEIFKLDIKKNLEYLEEKK